MQMDVYAAGEDEIKNINKYSLLKSLVSAGHKDVREHESFEDLRSLILEDLSEGDLVIFLGAGDITNYAKDFVSFINKEVN